jgi:magnesium-transporting ATPase (P-type)
MADDVKPYQSRGGHDTGTPPVDWYALAPDDVAARLDSPPDGLTGGEALARRARFGANRLNPPPARPAWKRLLAQFNNLLIMVLLAAGAVSLVLGQWTDAAVIAGVVAINAWIGFAQEDKAERALGAIRNLLAPHALVVRDGIPQTIDAGELVPGDRVRLGPGDRVPADVRLVRSRGLRVDESTLTGESGAVAKGTAPSAPGAALGERAGMAWSGSMVVEGQGDGLVVATGDTTEVGRIGAMLAVVEAPATPLQRRLDAFGRTLTIAILALAAGTFAFGWLVRGEPWDTLMMAAVSLAVAAVPEGLPAVMTITLAIGVTRMARRNAIIRRLAAVETLGSVAVVCTDKTGTLTRNELTVETVAIASGDCTVSGTGYRPQGALLRAGPPGQPAQPDGQPVDAATEPALLELARIALLCNDAHIHPDEDGVWRVSGDPTDGALLALAGKAGLDAGREQAAFPRLDVLPFESERGFMATLHDDAAGGGGGRLVLVKGAPERIVQRCVGELGPDGGARPLDRAAWIARIDALAATGLRLLALASRRIDAGGGGLKDGGLKDGGLKDGGLKDAGLKDAGLKDAGLKDAGPDGGLGDGELAMDGLILAGVCGLMDPARAEVPAALLRCREAGIAVKMITGDHAATASAIARALGFARPAPALTGPELERMDDAALVAAVRDTEVFARTTPEHKLRIVTALQAGGMVVAMTGDGVNDAPALRRADVGVAMGQRGTEAAKEAAAMVLADDNFASIAHAVEEGRTAYDNLRKTVLFLLPTNGAQALVIVAAVLAGYTVPIAPVQVLWVNLVTAVTLGLALAFEGPESGVMSRPPRPVAEPVLPGFLVLRIVLATALLVIASFGAFLLHEAQGDPPEVARTVAVNALVAGEIAFLLSARSVSRTALSLAGLSGSRPVWLSIGLMVALQVAFTHAPPMHALFHTASIDLADWVWLVGVGVAMLLVMEGEKALARRVFNRGA